MLLLLSVPGHFSACDLHSDLWPLQDKRKYAFVSGGPQWKAEWDLVLLSLEAGKTRSADWMHLWHSPATLTYCYLPDKTHTHAPCTVCVCVCVTSVGSAGFNSPWLQLGHTLTRCCSDFTPTHSYIQTYSINTALTYISTYQRLNI